MDTMEKFGRYLTEPEQTTSQSNSNNVGTVASPSQLAANQNGAEKIEKTVQTIKVQEANLREFPGFTAEVTDRLKKGTPVEVLTVMVDEQSKFIWCYVKVKEKYQTKYGWISYSTVAPK
jgi:hypothetical protein